MLERLLSKWKNPLKISETPIKHCKICFKPFKTPSFYELLNRDNLLCPICSKQLEPQFISFEIEGIKGLAIYEYDDNFKNILYQFKGCYDFELAPIFLNQYKEELHFLYSNYIVVPVPSYRGDDEKRGFNHVIEAFEYINLPMCSYISKTSPFKQASHKSWGRKQISKYL